jgi:hypothetical protein
MMLKKLKVKLLKLIAGKNAVILNCNIEFKGNTCMSDIDDSLIGLTDNMIIVYNIVKHGKYDRLTAKFKE